MHRGFENIARHRLVLVDVEAPRAGGLGDDIASFVAEVVEQVSDERGERAIRDPGAPRTVRRVEEGAVERALRVVDGRGTIHRPDRLRAQFARRRLAQRIDDDIPVAIEARLQVVAKKGPAWGTYAMHC